MKRLMFGAVALICSIAAGGCKSSDETAAGSSGGSAGDEGNNDTGGKTATGRAVSTLCYWLLHQ